MTRRTLDRKCGLCDKQLEPHEAREGYCDECLRANQTQPQRGGGKDPNR